MERQDGTKSYVYFEREFRMDEIMLDLDKKKVEDLVTFDETSRLVTFTLGNRIEKYILPDL